MKTVNQTTRTKRNADQQTWKGACSGSARYGSEVMEELVAMLSQKLVTQSARPGAEREVDRGPAPNRDRLTVGVDLGDKWSNYCILGLNGETLVEGEATADAAREDFGELFAALSPARVVMEVGTHSAWARDAVAGWRTRGAGGEPATRWKGSKKRKRKNDRIDAHKLARE